MSGLAPINDVSKLEVYELGRRALPRARRRSARAVRLAVVSPLVDEIIEGGRSRAELLDSGYPAAAVDDCLDRIARAEYERGRRRPGSA